MMTINNSTDTAVDSASDNDDDDDYMYQKFLLRQSNKNVITMNSTTREMQLEHWKKNWKGF
jgi:hypothetical protein